MIRANARSRLREADLQLAVIVLACGSAIRQHDLERRLERDGPDGLLDDRLLAERLLGLRTLVAPSEVLFVYVMVRRHLLDAGLADPELADYLASLVLDFGRGTRARRVEANDPVTHDYLVDLLAMLERSDGTERFLVLAHLGNYALWLAGLFPDRIAARQLRRGGPDVGYYDHLGRRGYGDASGHAMAASAGLVELYAAVAERFPALRVALNRMSDRVFFPQVVTTDRMFRELGRDAA
jgi:hypothetical protein